MSFFCSTHTFFDIVVDLKKIIIYYAVKYAIPNPNFRIINPLKQQYKVSKKQIQAIGGIDTCKKRTVPSTSFRKVEKGSLTVEAALALPVCLGMLFLLMGLFRALAVYEQINGQLCMTARSLAAYSEAYDGCSTVDAYRVFYLEMYGSGVNLDYVQGGYTGILLRVEEDTQDEGLLRLHAFYRIKVPGYFAGNRSIAVSDTVCSRAWIGGRLSGNQEKEASEHQYVYVAENGVVYHSSESCTYLQLSVHQVSASTVRGLRNTYGARYIPCERCGYASANGSVFITDKGNAWHTDRQCSGLKRNLHITDKEEAIHQGLRPCTRCGG